MRYDVLIVGGSFAGLAAALPLARARRRVLVVDAGLTRNRFSAHAHGFLGHDGKTPGAILEEARAQLLAYPTAEILHGEASAASGEADRFAVALSEGREVHARRLILTTGLSDELPDLPGLRERWGRSVLHCPYCHGYEVRDQPLGVLANHPMSSHTAVLLPDWGPTTFFTQGKYEPDAERTALLARRGVAVERTPVVELRGDAPGLSSVRLADGRVVPLGAVFVAPRPHLTGSLALSLGCVVEEGPMGPGVKTDDFKQTTVAGVYAAGDIARPMHSITLAVADGATAGTAAHQSLAFLPERTHDG